MSDAPYSAAVMPADLEAYRAIGPFDGESLPKGLRKDHQLKLGVWGRVTMLEGAIRFVWSDGRPGNTVEELQAGDVLMVPPQALHYLEETDPFLLKIEFLAEPDRS